MKYLSLLVFTVLLVQLAFCDEKHRHRKFPKRSTPPNIVILLADDMGYGDLSFYGHPTSTNPNLAKMASEGLIFRQFYSAAALCSPSRAALLTGRYQTRTGIYPGVLYPTNLRGLPLNETTIPEALKTKGYYTAVMGKWHLGIGVDQEYLPLNQGFDTYVGIPTSLGFGDCTVCFYPDVACGEDGCNLDMFTSVSLFVDNDLVQQPADFLTLTETYVDKAVDVIQEASDSSTPFFIYMSFTHMHTPQYAGERWTNSSIRGPYGDALNEMDWAVGEIFEALEDNNVDDNTFVFFTSDNGPDLIEPGGTAGLLRCGKSSTWEGGMREPAIAWWPGSIAPGVTQELAATVDLLPTLLTLAGAELPDVPLDGVDMSPILFGDGQSNRNAYYYYGGTPTPEDGVFAVRWNQYKAHFFSEGGIVGPDDNYPDEVCRGSYTKRALDPPLLYDLEHDSSELFPLDTTDPTYAEILDTMTAMKAEFDANMAWVPSANTYGFSIDADPCAQPGCSSYPSCCTTD